MIAMYLLGNPDHYTNHTFKSFYWQSYVTEARRFWYPDEEGNFSDKVMLMKRKGQILGLSPVFDYIYRSPELENMTLYEWILRGKRMANRKVTNKESDKSPQEEEESSDENELLSTAETFVNTTEKSVGGGTNKQVTDKTTDPGAGNKDFPKRTQLEFPKGRYTFGTDHPLHKSHYTSIAEPNQKVVANFIGKELPRCDQGDREYYCSTMLSFFKPWRSGKDLKLPDVTWDDTFKAHGFSERQKEIMKLMNIKYECLDSRDDFRAQLKKGTIELPVWDKGVVDELGESGYEDAHIPNPDQYDDEDIPLHLLSYGRHALTRAKEIEVMNSVMQNTGWTTGNPDGLPKNVNIDPAPITRILSGPEWMAEIGTKKQNVLEKRREHMGKTDDTTGQNAGKKGKFIPNQVKVMDKSYLFRKKHSVPHAQEVSDIVNEFCLNSEQERAFRIVANHAVNPASEPLKMYLGGMGGTGKSQVLKALSKFFERRNESHRFAIVAPTGNAASLLGGSTYHSFFGINARYEGGQTKLAEVRANLLGVDYVFLDEVSMLSAHDLYKISAQLCRVLNNLEEPFGGVSMIFAGDFAQLPPVIGHEGTSLYSRTIGAISTNLKKQEEALGKAVWHQITTVVILRKNMRMTEQTSEDQKFRTALENM